jgi:hypothetical protein
MTRATTSATPNPAPKAAPGSTTYDVCATARGQIEFSLNVLRIASPREPVSKRLSDANSGHIFALEELLASIDPSVEPDRASEGAA